MLLLFMTIRDNSVRTKVKNIKSTKLNNKKNQAKVLWILRFILDNFWDILMIFFEIHP